MAVMLILSSPLTDCGYGCQTYLVRLLTYLPGITISKAPLTPQLLYETGKMAARMDTILQKVYSWHPCEYFRSFVFAVFKIPELFWQHSAELWAILFQDKTLKLLKKKLS